MNPSVLCGPWVFCFSDLITGLFNQKQFLLWSNSVGIHTCDKQIRLSLCPCLLFWINHDEPFQLQDLIGTSPYCLPYNSYNTSLESLVLNQLIIPYSIFFFILITLLLDIVLILQEEILSWSFMGVKGHLFSIYSKNWWAAPFFQKSSLECSVIVSLRLMNSGWRRLLKTWLWISFDSFKKPFFPKIWAAKFRVQLICLFLQQLQFL